MEWTLLHLTTLDQAIALGVKRVEYHDKTVEYRSLSEMFKVRRFIWSQLYPDNPLSSPISRSGRVYASVSKGTR